MKAWAGADTGVSLTVEMPAGLSEPRTAVTAEWGPHMMTVIVIWSLFFKQKGHIIGKTL